jgi:RNA polymerase sigma factor (sigma-70 family)
LGFQSCIFRPEKNGRATNPATSIFKTNSTVPEHCRMAGVSSREVLRHLNTLFQCGAAGQLSDAELLERFVAGRDEAAEAAFAALVERHGVMVLGVCRRVLGNRDAAEDAFQATFLVLAKKASAIARREQLASWLHGVARRAALDARARASRQKAREKRLGAMLPVEPPDQTMTSELRAVLDEELARLPERHRTAILLCELEGLSRREAANRLGISEGTLSSRLSRAKSRLRDRLTRRGFALSSAALASVMAQDAHAVILPPILLDSTIRVATLVATGCSLAEVVSTSVVTLTEGVLKAMLLAKLKYVFLGLVTVAVVSSSVGVVAQVSPPRKTDDDRLQSVERKLDKLLEVLGGSSRRNSPTATSPVLPPDAPPPPATVPAPVPPPPPDSGSPRMGSMMAGGMMPGSMHGMGMMQGGMRGMGSAMMGQPNLAGRVDQMEKRLNDLERRLTALERRLTSSLPRAPGSPASLELRGAIPSSDTFSPPRNSSSANTTGPFGDADPTAPPRESSTTSSPSGEDGEHSKDRSSSPDVRDGSATAAPRRAE